MLALLKKFIIGSPFETFVRIVMRKPVIKFKNTAQYWEDRYKSGGNSGEGSYGRLSEFKAKIINDFVVKNNIVTVIEFGCGDGNQLFLSNYKKYIGVDISTQSINLCKERFQNDENKIFMTYSSYNGEQSELSLSLDVIYHLIEEDTFDHYMKNLFNSSTKFVIIYSCNYVEPSGLTRLN